MYFEVYNQSKTTAFFKTTALQESSRKQSNRAVLKQWQEKKANAGAVVMKIMMMLCEQTYWKRAHMKSSRSSYEGTNTTPNHKESLAGGGVGGEC